MVHTVIDYDIIIDIMRMLARDETFDSTSAVAAISQTCKCLSFEGARLLLSCSVIVTRRIPSFCLFMFRDRTTRPFLLRNLCVDVRNVTEHTIEGFSEVLYSAVNLTDLTIHALDHPSSSLKPTLCSLIASLVPIRHLTLSSIHLLQTVESLIRDIQASLSSISLNLPFQGELNHDSPIMYTRRRDPIFLFSSLKNTMEEIRVHGPVTFGSYTCVYPHVKEMRIPDHVFTTPIIKPIIMSFPRLQVLYIGSAVDSYVRSPHEEDILDQVYIGKRSIQQCHNINKQNQSTHGTWTMLKFFKATIVAAYALGLSCSVEKMQLMSTGGKREQELTMLSAILSDTKPRSLRLALRAFHARTTVPIFSSPETWSTRLQTLELRMNIAQVVFNYEELFVSQVYAKCRLIK